MEVGVRGLLFRAACLPLLLYASTYFDVFLHMHPVPFPERDLLAAQNWGVNLQGQRSGMQFCHQGSPFITSSGVSLDQTTVTTAAVTPLPRAQLTVPLSLPLSPLRMVSSPASGPMSPWTLWLLILLLSVASLVESRSPPLNSEDQLRVYGAAKALTDPASMREPSKQVPDLIRKIQITDGLFGTRGGSLLRNHLDPCGGCEDLTPPAWRGGRGTHGEPGIEPRNAPPGLLLDFMGRQRKFKGRTRKSSQMGGGHAGASIQAGC